MTTVRITDAGGNKPSFTQWDVDRVVIVSGVTSQPMLHFANAELKRAIVVEATDDNGRWKCLVPNFILQYACPMVVSVFVQPDEGCTVATAVYGVQPKLKPQDYSYTENIGYINWVAKSEEVQDLIDTIQGMLDRGELKGDPFTYEDFTPEQLAALKGDPGADGVSPTVSTEVTYYGNKVTFTDADGDHTINVLDGMTATVKSALLNLFQHVAYVDDQGQTYYDALYDAFNPVLNVDYITVVFDPGTAVIYNTDELASLKPYITCTAYYEDGSEAEVDTYTLSGTLAAGTDTITVTYGGKTATFTVTVVEWLVSIDAVFTPEQAAPVTIDPTRVSAYITTDGRWLASSDAYSVCVPVTNGKRYKFQFTSTSSTDVGTIFRFGFSDTNTPTEQTLAGLIRSTPQDYVATEITASGSYLVIQLGASVASGAISNGYLTLTELGTVIYDTDSLNTLKQYLVVTATYADSTTATVIDYTLSGALAVGTSTITASYGGKTDTFSVTVVKYWDISWDYTMGTPIGNGWKTGTSLPGAMESDGFKLSSTSTAGGEFAHDPNIEDTEGIFEVDLTLSQIGSAYQGFCIFSPGMRLRIYSGKLWFNGSSTNTQASQTQIASISANTKYTIRWEYVKANFARVYVDGTLVHTQSSALEDNTTRLFVNNTPASSAVATIHAIRFREVS